MSSSPLSVVPASASVESHVQTTSKNLSNSGVSSSSSSGEEVVHCVVPSGTAEKPSPQQQEVDDDDDDGFTTTCRSTISPPSMGALQSAPTESLINFGQNSILQDADAPLPSLFGVVSGGTGGGVKILAKPGGAMGSSSGAPQQRSGAVSTSSNHSMKMLVRNLSDDGGLASTSFVTSTGSLYQDPPLMMDADLLRPSAPPSIAASSCTSTNFTSSGQNYQGCVADGCPLSEPASSN